MSKLKAVILLGAVVFMTGCHHGMKPQDCDREPVKEAQVIMTLEQQAQDSMATLDMADFAHRY